MKTKCRQHYNSATVAIYVSAALCLLFVIVMLYSWIVAAVDTSPEVRSLLGSDGIRWMCGTFVENLLSPMLVWMLMAAMTTGLVRKSCLHKAVLSYRQLSGFEQRALWVVLFEIVFLTIVVAVLTLSPHAVLLSAIGKLFPSSFSVFVVPLICLALGISALSYGNITGSIASVEDVVDSLSAGLGMLAPWLVVYMVAAELWHSLIWIGLI